MTKDLDILKTIRDFYKKLYTNETICETTQNKLLNNITPKFKNSQKEQLITRITGEEIKNAIFSMENGKSPGIDGIPIEFYKAFFETLEEDLVTLYNDILFEQKELSPSMNKAVITLLPKKGDLNDLKNWRPISLLCTDYKILTKIISTRLRQTMKHIISQEQTCSVLGRNIFSNLFF